MPGVSLPVTVIVGTPVSFTVTFTPDGNGRCISKRGVCQQCLDSPASTTLDGQRLRHRQRGD